MIVVFFEGLQDNYKKVVWVLSLLQVIHVDYKEDLARSLNSYQGGSSVVYVFIFMSHEMIPCIDILQALWDVFQCNGWHAQPITCVIPGVISQSEELRFLQRQSTLQGMATIVTQSLTHRNKTLWFMFCLTYLFWNHAQPLVLSLMTYRMTELYLNSSFTSSWSGIGLYMIFKPFLDYK